MNKTNAVLLLFLLLNLTGCVTATTGGYRGPRIPQVVSLQPNDVDQFDLILVTRSDGTQLEVENPSVENNDELVGTARTSQLGLAETGGRVPISIPLADIETIEAVDGTGTSYVLSEAGKAALLLPVALVGFGALGFLFLMGIGGGFGS